MATKAKKAKARVKGRKRPAKERQTYLPDMEPPKIPALDNAIEKTVDINARQKELEADEELLTEQIVALLKDAGLPRYENDAGYILTHKSTSTDKISIKKRKEPKPKKEPSKNGDGE